MDDLDNGVLEEPIESAPQQTEAAETTVVEPDVPDEASADPEAAVAMEPESPAEGDVTRAESEESAPEAVEVETPADVEGPQEVSEAETAEEPQELQEPQETSASTAPAPAEEPTGEVSTEAVAEDAAVLPVVTAPRIPWWPFLGYGVLWVALVVYAATQISTADTAPPAIEQSAYPYVVLAGMVLALLGPLTSVVLWVVVWVRAGAGRRSGLFTTAFVRGAIFTLLGVAAWWGALYILDALRLGIIGPLG